MGSPYKFQRYISDIRWTVIEFVLSKVQNIRTSNAGGVKRHTVCPR